MQTYKGAEFGAHDTSWNQATVARPGGLLAVSWCEKAKHKKKKLCVYICMGCSCEDATWRGETQRLLWSAPGQWDGPSENYNDALAYEQAGSRECRTKMLWQSVAAAASSLCIWTMGRGIHKRDDVLHSLFPTKENADAEWIMRALGKELFIPYAKEW